MHKHERLAQLIGQGLKPKEALTLTGVSEAYFSRLKDTEEFKEHLRLYAAPDKAYDQEAAAAHLAEHTANTEHELREDKWAALEAATLNSALASIPMAELKDVNKTLDILAKRRVGHNVAAAMHKSADAQIQLVTLALPQHTRERIIDAQVVTTSQGEVIKAGERDLTPLSTASVADLLEASRPATQLTADDI